MSGQGMLASSGHKLCLGFDLRMPTKWNGRFAFQGGGGLDGRLAPALGEIFGSVRPSALARGFAVVGTDGGHRGPWLDGSFGLNQQARVDYACNALNKVTLKAKESVAKYYGSAPKYSYLLGCSNGGCRGLIASQRLPLYFDGIAAGDPSIGFSRATIAEMWNLQVAARISAVVRLQTSSTCSKQSWPGWRKDLRRIKSRQQAKLFQVHQDRFSRTLSWRVIRVAV
jgi:hypothetical protein